MVNIFNNKNKVKLKILRKHHISKEYINWLNDYEVVKFTNQKFKKHNYTNVEKFVYANNNEIGFDYLRDNLKNNF